MKLKTFKIVDRDLAIMINGSLCQRDVNFKTTVHASGETEFEFSETEIKKQTTLNEIWDFTTPKS